MSGNVDDATLIDALDDDEQPYGEPFTDEWRAEHVRRADQSLAEFDEAMRLLEELDDDDATVGPTVMDFMMFSVLAERAKAGYAAANVRSVSLSEPRPAPTDDKLGHQFVGYGTTCSRVTSGSRGTLCGKTRAWHPDGVAQ